MCQHTGQYTSSIRHGRHHHHHQHRHRCWKTIRWMVSKGWTFLPHLLQRLYPVLHSRPQTCSASFLRGSSFLLSWNSNTATDMNTKLWPRSLRVLWVVESSYHDFDLHKSEGPMFKHHQVSFTWSSRWRSARSRSFSSFPRKLSNVFLAFGEKFPTYSSQVGCKDWKVEGLLEPWSVLDKSLPFIFCFFNLFCLYEDQWPSTHR